MPKVLYSFLLTVSTCLLFAQPESKQVDTVFISDTIYQTRKIQEVVYIDGLPESYFSAGVHTGISLQQYNSELRDKQWGIGNFTGLSFDYCRNRLLLKLNVDYVSFSRDIQEKRRIVDYFSYTKEVDDTISWFYQTVDGVTQIIYIIEPRTVSVIDSTESDSLVSSLNSYRNLSLPFMVGYRLREGILSIDGYIGVTPVFNLEEYESNRALTESDDYVPESAYVKKMGLDCNASVSFKYLISLNIYANIDLKYSYSAIPIVRESGIIPVKKHDFAIDFGIAYVFSSK